MTRSVAHRVIVFALVIWVSGQMAVAGGSPMAAGHQPPGTVQAPGSTEGSLVTVGYPSGGSPYEGAVGTPFGDLRPPTLVGMVNAMLLSPALGIEGAAWFVPPIALAAEGPHRTGDGPSFENENRETVYRAITESASRYVSELAALTGISESTVRHHVRVLEADGLIRSSLIRGERHCYLPTVDEWVVKLEAALAYDSTASILAAVARLEPASVTTLAEQVDLAPSTVSYHLGRLADDDLVDRERTGQSVVTRLDPAVRTHFRETAELGGENADEGSE